MAFPSGHKRHISTTKLKSQPLLSTKSSRPCSAHRPRRRVLVSASLCLGAASPWRPTHTLSRHQLCSMVADVAAAGHSPSQGWLASCAEQARPHLRSLPPQTLAALLVSFVRMRFHPGDDWVADFDSAVVSHPQKFDPSSTTDILSGLAALGAGWVRFPEFVVVRLTSSAGSLAQEAAPLDSPTTTLDGDSTATLDGWSYLQLSRTLRCLTNLGIRLEEPTLEVVGSHMAQQLTIMPPSELQSLMQQELSRPLSAVAANR